MALFLLLSTAARPQPREEHIFTAYVRPAIKTMAATFVKILVEKQRRR